MISEDRISTFYEMWIDNDVYMEAGKTLESILTKIRQLLFKIKKIIDEKLLKKEKKVNIENKPVEVDQGIWNKIKSGLNTIKKFLTIPIQKISKLLTGNKGIVAVVIGIIGVAAIKDLKNGHNIKVQRDEYNRIIKNCKINVEVINKTLYEMKKGEEDPSYSRRFARKLNLSDDELKTVYAKSREIKSDELMRTLDKQAKATEELNKLPQYGSILYRIASWIGKVVNFLDETGTTGEVLSIAGNVIKDTVNKKKMTK